MKNNISDLSPKRKSATEIMSDFDKWIEKIQNVHRGNIQKNGRRLRKIIN